MKIAIDAGHGLYTLGKRCDFRVDPNETSEWFLNQRIACKIIEILSKYDCETKRLDDISGRSDTPLMRRTDTANSWGADFVISCHHNAGIHGGKGGGISVFTYTKPSSASVSMQKAIYESCMKHGGLSGRSEPMNRANFHMVREPKCKNAVLIEYGFMDSTTDTPIILTEDFAERMAMATAKAIISELKLKKKGYDEPMTDAERKEFTELGKRVQALESQREKVYHYWEEIKRDAPWAYDAIKAMYNEGYFKGASASDLNLSQTKLECLVTIAAILKKKGSLKY